MAPFYSQKIFHYTILFFIFAANLSEGETTGNLYKKAFDLSIAGKAENAIKLYLEVLKINPSSAETHHALGVLYYETNNGTQAIDHFRKAELFYKKRSDKKATLNLTIVKNNLKKAYKKLNLNPDDFKFDILRPTKNKWKPSGIGFLIGRDGYLFTSAPSISGAKKIRIRFPNGQLKPAKLIREFIVYKIAILKLVNTIKGLSHPLIFEEKPNFAKGRPVYAMDFSKLTSNVHSLSKGIILKEQALENSNKVVQIDLGGKIQDNGGPLFNANGRLIGLIFTKRFAQKSFPYLMDSPEHASFAIKSSYLKKVLSGLIHSRNDIKNQSKDLDLNHGINISDVSGKTINNFVFLEIYN